jgi:proteasome lid subunit RPN8/RPN11
MNLQVHPDQLQSIARHLARAQRREIGGVLVGEHVSEDLFRVVDLSFQRSGGAVACFVRRPEEHESFFAEFFQRTGKNFERFNYLGEWHSHPSFPVHPSAVDHDQMQAIVEDGANAPLFAVLIVVRLAGSTEVELSATAYRSGCAASPVAVHVSPRPPDDPTPVRAPWWRRILEPESKEVRLSVVRVGCDADRSERYRTSWRRS